MTEQQASSVLRRKASEGRQEHLSRAMSPAKALRLGLERAAEKGLGLALEVTGTRLAEVGHAALAGQLDGRWLLALLDGADGEPAAVAVDMQALGGLVEHQTIGKVVAREVTGRVPTRVDAALITPFLEDALDRFVTLLREEESVPAWLQTYRFGAMAAGPRALALALTANDYHLFELDLSLAGGAKSGRIALIFPDCRVMPETAGEDGFEAAVAEEFRRGVMAAPATLNAVLTRVRIPITRLQNLSVGDVLTVPADVLSDTLLEATNGDEVARVQFGQINGMRAVRLRGRKGAAPPDDTDADGFVGETSGQPSTSDLDDMLAAETALDALLPPLEDDPLEDDLSGAGLEDFDDLIQLSADDIGDPAALAELSLPDGG